MKKKEKISALYKESVISKIKEIINKYGLFSIREVQNDCYPSIETKGNLSHLVETYHSNYVGVIIYNESDVALDGYTLFYEELETDVLEDILDLCKKWKEICEEQEL